MALETLEDAEKKVIAALEDASTAFKVLSSADSARASPFDRHAESFLSNLSAAQQLIRSRISALSPDLPFENGSNHHLLEADLAMQRITHVHTILQNILEDVRHFPGPSVKIDADIVDMVDEES